jgi:carboxyl-terminal processing protease
MTKRSSYLLGLLILAAMVSAFVAGKQFESLARASQGEPLDPVRTSLAAAGGQAIRAGVSDDVDLQPVQVFQESLDYIRGHYVEPIKDERRLGYGAVRGMIAALGDPYSRFMEASAYGDFQRENEGHFDGIGATLRALEVKPGTPEWEALPEASCPTCGQKYRPRTYHITVVKPLPGSPAAKAGVQEGDIITAINGKSTKEMSLPDAVTLIRGHAGTVVTLTVRRAGVEKPITARIRRGVISVPNVESRMVGDGIGYLRLNTFNEQSEDAVAKALDGLTKRHMRALVLDVRDNSGGLLDSAVAIGRLFVKQEPLVYVQESGRARQGYTRGRRHREPLDEPMVVLVNRFTASASEILAGAIQDRGVGQLVGQKTYGKGMVQTVYPLKDGSALVLTTAKYFTPAGRDIDQKGIQPNVTVDLPPDVEPASAQDAQFATAVKLLRQRLAQR